LKNIEVQRGELAFPAALSLETRAARNSRLMVQHSFSAQTNLHFTLAQECQSHKRVPASFCPGISLYYRPGKVREVSTDVQFDYRLIWIKRVEPGVSKAGVDYSSIIQTFDMISHELPIEIAKYSLYSKDNKPTGLAILTTRRTSQVLAICDCVFAGLL
jgi:hypothetical protein